MFNLKARCSRILPASVNKIPSEDTSNGGFCHCCRKNVWFDIEGSWLRDQYFCRECRSIPRQRHINHILDSFFSGWERLSIHESSPSNDFLSRWSSNYSASQYFEGVAEGSMHRGFRSENLERLTFADETFDIFITQDVLEHVFDPAQALREIMRVLKPGGAHVFTAPKTRGIAKSYPRATLLAGKIDYLLEPVYHGNPVGDGRALVTWDYGDDFEVLMHDWCGYPTVTYVTRDRKLGIDGEYLEVFATRKLESAAAHRL